MVACVVFTASCGWPTVFVFNSVVLAFLLFEVRCFEMCVVHLMFGIMLLFGFCVVYGLCYGVY